MDTGTAYIGVVGPENEIGLCRDTIHNVVRRPGDAMPFFIRATKGFEARQAHLNKFIDKTKHDWLFMMDHDMMFPPDALERLRSHGKPFVSGLYMRRQYAPIAPVWFRPFDGKFPLTPWTGKVEKGKLHEIGASGWGCMLLHRQVILDTRKVLKGEQEILEDDMDVWPYDPERLFGAVNGIVELAKDQPPAKTLRAALKTHAAVLAEEMRPLRGVRSIMGSDIRFPFYALQAGYQLYGDPDVECGHVVDYSVTPDDWKQVPDETLANITEKTGEGVVEQRGQIAEVLEVLNG